MDKPLRLDYSEKEKELAKLGKDQVIHALRGYPIKVKYLIISSLFESFPTEYLLELKGDKE